MIVGKFSLLKLVGKNKTHSPNGGLIVISHGRKQEKHLKQNKKKEDTGLLFDWILDPYVHIP